MTANVQIIEEIRSFFMDVKKEEVDSIFSAILEACFTTDDPMFETSEARFELLTILKRIECLIDAASKL